MLCLLALAGFAGCGSDAGPTVSGPGEAGRGETDYAAMRDKVVRGFAEEFREGTGAEPQGYGLCVRLGLDRVLTREQLNRLVAIYRRPDGQQFAAHALVSLAGSVGAECGGARYVPEMVKASEALAGEYPLGRLEIAARRLGIVYGPYLGLTCRKAGAHRCDEVGIDVVLRERAAALTAWVGGQRVSLRTPGLHNGAPQRDWVGFLRNVGLERPGSAFHLPRRSGRWAGFPAVTLPVRLEVVEPDGEKTFATLPQVFLSPGWG